MPSDSEIVARFVEATGSKLKPVVGAFAILLERSWPVRDALKSLRDAHEAPSPEASCRGLLRAIELVQERHDTAMFWWKDEDSRFLGFCRRLPVAAGLPVPELVGNDDSDPRIAWNRQAALYLRDDREVLSSGAPRFDILERQDRLDGTVWLRTSKVPFDAESGRGTVGGFDTITVAEAQRLRKSSRP